VPVRPSQHLVSVPLAARVGDELAAGVVGSRETTETSLWTT
jgi:hypothetical protein